MKDAVLLGKAYASVSNKLQNNTEQILLLIQKRQINTPEFEKLWAERDATYTDWNNIIHWLQELSVDDMSIVVKEIPRMLTRLACI